MQPEASQACSAGHLGGLRQLANKCSGTTRVCLVTNDTRCVRSICTAPARSPRAITVIGPSEPSSRTNETKPGPLLALCAA